MECPPSCHRQRLSLLHSHDTQASLKNFAGSTFPCLLQGSEISTPYSSVTSLSEDTLLYLETHQHLLPGAKRPASASRSRVASLRHSVCPPCTP